MLMVMTLMRIDDDDGGDQADDDRDGVCGGDGDDG